MEIARGYKNYGLCLQANGDIIFKEWAPEAKSLSVFGDFNEWNRGEFKCEKNEYGCFSTTIKANPDGTPRIKHNTKYKINMEGADGKLMDRNSAWSKYQLQDKNTFLYDCVFWNPPTEFVWTHKRPIAQPT